MNDVECPSCGTHFSLIGDETATYTATEVKRLGHFELIDRVGIGGFGSIWKARDTELDRVVAIKIPRKGQLDAEETEHFLREARAAAQVTHPNIVGIHEVGRYEDSVYIVSEFVEGANLSDWQTGHKFTPQEAASLCIKLANALHEAHEAGVVHRDLKPGNIMLDRQGEPSITDFGLAKRETGEITMTVEGKILGTPAFMSPELARGAAHTADRRTDIYSLGVILFQLLTGELPFRGEPRMLIVQILRDDPPSPRKLNSAIPRDLETICLKCLEKDPGQRYATATELAGDLRHYLDGEPINARPISRSERSWRWCKRHPATAALFAISAVAIFALAVLAVRLQYENQLKTTNADLAIALGELRKTGEQLKSSLDTSESLRKDIERSNTAIADANERLEEVLYFRRISLAEKMIHDRRIDAAVTLLNECPDHLRNWEWNHLARRAFPESRRLEGMPIEGDPVAAGHDSVSGVAYTADGKYLLSAGSIQDRTSYNEKVGILESIWRGAVLMWDAESGKIVKTVELLTQDKSRINCVAVDRSGTRVATGTGKIWNLETAQEVATLEDCERLSDVSFNPSGKHVAGSDSVWDAETGKRLQKFEKSSKLQFCNDDNSVLRLVLDNAQRTFRITDIRTGEDTCSIEVNGVPETIAMSPDGSTIAFTRGTADFVDFADIYERSYHEVVLCDVESGKETVAPEPHFGETKSLAFSADSKYLFSGGAYSIKKRDGKTGEFLTKYDTNRSVQALAVAPSGTTLAAGVSRWVKLYDINDNPAGHLLHTLASRVIAVRTSTEGDIALGASYERDAIVWDTTTGKVLFELPSLERAALSSNGKFVASSQGTEILILEARTGKTVQVIPTDVSRKIAAMAFSPDGSCLAVFSNSSRDVSNNCLGRITILNLADLTNPHYLFPSLNGESPCPLRRFTYTADGKRIAGLFPGKVCRIWDAETGEEVVTIRAPNSGFLDFAFDPTNRYVALAYWQGIRVHRVADGEFMYEVRPHRNLVQAVEFMPDGDRIITSSLDGEVKIFESTRGLEVLTFKGHKGMISGLAFAPKEAKILTGGPMGDIRSWCGAETSLPSSPKRLAAAESTSISSASGLPGGAAGLVTFPAGDSEAPEPPVTKPTVTPTPLPRLDIGDPAPPFKLARWFLGEPFEKIEPGKVYVIEFWGSWCPPCRTSIPHLSALQDKYGDDVRFLGITKENETVVENFLKSDHSEDQTWSDVVTYRMALDNNSATNNSYMRAAGQTGIPCAFIVNRDGIVDWIGLPIYMDEALAKIVSGQWDRSGAIAMARQKQRLKDIGGEIDALQRKEEWDRALAMVTRLEKDYGLSPDSVKTKISLLEKAERPETVATARRELVDLVWDEPMALNEFAWQHATGGGERDLSLALRAAERASELREHKDAAILDTVARTHYELGNLDKAIEWQRRAANCNDDTLVILETLVKYETEKALLIEPEDPRRQQELERIEALKSPVMVIREAGGSCRMKSGSGTLVTSVAFANTSDIDQKLVKLQGILEEMPSLADICFSGVQHISSPTGPEKPPPPTAPPTGGITDDGMSHIAGLTGLKSLQLLGVEVSDAGLKHVAKMADLQSLCISGAEITDDGLQYLKKMTKLKSLQLTNVKINGSGFAECESMSSLATLDLKSTDWSNEGMEHLKDITSLVSLNLSYTKITDEGLKSLDKLGSLRYLDLQGTRITDAGMKYLTGLTSLSSLNLSETQVTGTGLQQLNVLDGLTQLRLNNAPVTDDSLVHLSGLKLTTLSLDRTRITDAGMRHLSALSSLAWLTLGDTEVSDEGLKHLFGLAKLRILGSTNTKITPDGRKKLKAKVPGLRL